MVALTEGGGGAGPIVILGGGYAGHMAAARAARACPGAPITLVDAEAELVERVRLHQRLAGTHGARRPRGPLLPRGVRFVQGRARRLDVDGRWVHVETPEGDVSLPYGQLVLALGAGSDPGGVPGAAEHAWHLDGPHARPGLRERAEALARSGGSWVVVGGGLTGIEAAAELVGGGGGRPRVHLVSAGPLAEGQSGAAAAHIRAHLRRRGVTVIEGIPVAEVGPREVRLSSGERIPAEATLWCGGRRAGPLAAEAGLPVDGCGRVRVGPTLQVLGRPEIFAVGDAARVELPSGQPLGMACAAALPMGAHAGEALGSLLRGEAPRPFRYGAVVRCVSLGRRDGVIDRLNADGSPTGQALTGWAAAGVKELICRMAAGVSGWEVRVGRPLYQWPRSLGAGAAPALPGASAAAVGG